jgi:hypothetical protein
LINLALLLAEGDLEKRHQAFSRAPAQFAEQLPVIEKKLAQDLRNTENVLTVRDGEEDRFF